MVDAYRLLAHKAVVAAEYAAAVAVRLVGRLLLVAAIKEGKGGSQIEVILKLEKGRENHIEKIATLEMTPYGQIEVNSTQKNMVQQKLTWKCNCLHNNSIS